MNATTTTTSAKQLSPMDLDLLSCDFEIAKTFVEASERFLDEVNEWLKISPDTHAKGMMAELGKCETMLLEAKVKIEGGLKKLEAITDQAYYLGEQGQVSAVLAFPQRNKGRVRKGGSVASMGRLAIMQLELGGGHRPDNVELLGYKEPDIEITKSPELLLALSCFEALDGEQKQKVRETVATLAYGHFNKSALQLHSLLRQVRP